MGITQFNNITIENVTSIVSGANPEDFFLRVNHVVYGMLLYFVLLMVLWYIIFKFAQKVENQPLHNMFYASLIVSIIAFFTRAIYGVYSGTAISLITDEQLWIFPILTTILGTILWITKQD